ncbi:MAG TPA: lysylphosphatidylglycerol synthase domain-containing protein [Methylomirabilota bacterium]|nr:lysylphosphatidylglycerol synthase domain-containing protein [Methylomirabilota bacterium]
MRLVRVLAALAGLAGIAWLVWEIGPESLLAQLRELSWRLPVLFLPYSLVAVLDAAGWRYAFPGQLPGLPVLVAARLAGEAVNVTTPTATLGGEPLKAWLLTRARVPFEEGLVSIVVAKTALVVSHLGFLVLAVALAIWQTRPAPALLTLMVTLTVLGILAVGGFVWAQLHGLFGASSRALAWLGVGDGVGGHLLRLDDHLVAYYRGQRDRLALSLFFHFSGWVAGSVEVWLALLLLGSPVDFATAIVIEGFASAIRSATFLIPASLGIQEGGFVGIFLGFGLSAGAGLAFGLVRRLRELLWAVAGYTILVAWRGPRGSVTGPGL